MTSLPARFTAWIAAANVVGFVVIVSQCAAFEPDLAKLAAEKYPHALAGLCRKADAAVAQRPGSVMEKTELPPSADRHDFFTLSPYHWPDPKSHDGLPYVFRDGQLNPDASSGKYDRVAYFRMGDAVRDAALAYRLTGRDAYAEAAARHLRTWFLDPATRMNPNFDYAQFVPGKDDGNRTGIIRGTLVVELVEAAHWLDGSEHWTDKDRQAWLDWQRDYLRWLLEGELGRAESRAMNNHGTWYDVQVATLAVECGEADTARQVLSSAAKRRIAPQIAPDGRQPFELLRTKSWDYSVFNLEAMFRLAALAEPLGIDLWNQTGKKGGSIRRALDYLAPFATGEAPWRRKQIRDFEPEKLYPLLIVAAEAYDEPAYLAAAARISGDAPARNIDALRLLARGFDLPPSN